MAQIYNPSRMHQIRDGQSKAREPKMADDSFCENMLPALL